VDQLIRSQVKNGKGSMPAFNLSDGEINAIIEFMSQTFKR